MCVLTILMIAYCCFALPLTARMARDAHVRGLEVTLSDPQSRFVGVSDVIAESGIDPDTVKRCLQYRFPIGDVESRLRRADKFQSANVSLGADGVVRVYVRAYGTRGKGLRHKQAQLLHQRRGQEHWRRASDTTSTSRSLWALSTASIPHTASSPSSTESPPIHALERWWPRSHRNPTVTSSSSPLSWAMW